MGQRFLVKLEHGEPLRVHFMLSDTGTQQVVAELTGVVDAHSINGEGPSSSALGFIGLRDVDIKNNIVDTGPSSD